MIYLVIILVAVGMWMGINFAKDKPLFSNPFAEQDIRDKAKGTAKNLLDEAKSAVEKTMEK
jgi:hypothetical protein